jgi:competence protein ComEA
LLTDQLAGRAADPIVGLALGPAPYGRGSQGEVSPEHHPVVEPGDEVSTVPPAVAAGPAEVDPGDVSSLDPGGSPGRQLAGAADRREPMRNNTSTTVRAGVGRHAARPLPWHRRLLAVLLDRAPAGAHGVSSTHVMVLALVGLGAVAIAAWWLTGARPQAAPIADAALIEEPVSTVQAGVEGPPTATADPPPSGSSESIPTQADTSVPAVPNGAASHASEVVVDVAGKVRRPGIVVLPAGSRVADALEAAGGVRQGVDTAALNLARPLLDGEQVLVGLTPLGSPDGLDPASAGPGAAVTASPGGPTALVNLNTATLEQLDTLPGVGPVTGQAILDWRTEHGAFTSVEELLEVDGIGDATLADLRDLVTV